MLRLSFQAAAGFSLSASAAGVETGVRGEKGSPGLLGDKGERGADGATIISWQLDRERYRVSPLMSDGTVGPMLELRELFVQFLFETS